ncbi:MAG: CopG family transcriptional regulator [Candidatus Micrarchaeota archaeon]|nr:CopG family transcriptional regulator [Candidatus Micrarchaeota archaeon]MDE1864432.1 CopG family transcriptional regulator [Candidatus Micrarchaeota archaeon]
MAPKRKYTTITIPTILFERMKASIENAGFSSVSDYVTFILRETTAKLSNAKVKKAKGSKSKEEGEIIDKLRALGYI